MFCQITKNWENEQYHSYQNVKAFLVNMIDSTHCIKVDVFIFSRKKQPCKSGNYAGKAMDKSTSGRTCAHMCNLRLVCVGVYTHVCGMCVRLCVCVCVGSACM